eukprot:NODE_15_length_42055_cov_0.634117.p10 type:complete len:378 gc:universal NODE_15_length_42055_cov_0.634117:30542-29409(-)
MIDSTALLFLSELEMLEIKESDKSRLTELYEKLVESKNEEINGQLREIQEDNKNAKDDLNYLKTQYDDIVFKYNSLQQMHMPQTNSTTIAELEEYITSLQISNENLENSLKSERKHTQTCIDTYESEIENLKSQVYEMEQIQLNLEDEKLFLQKEKSQIKLLSREDSSIDVLEELQNEVYVLNQRSLNEKSTIKELKKELNEVIEDRDELDKLVDQLEVEVEYLTNVKQEYDGQRERIQSMKDSLEMSKYESKSNNLRNQKAPSTVDLRNGLSSLFDELRASASGQSTVDNGDDNAPVGVFILGLEAIVEFFFGCFRFVYLIMTACLYAVLGPSLEHDHKGSPFIEEVDEFEAGQSPLNSLNNRGSMSSIYSKYSFK